MYTEIPVVCMTVSQLLLKSAVFIVVTLLIFLKLAPEICASYNNN